MPSNDRLQRLLRSALRSAGREFETARQRFGDAKGAAVTDLPQDEDGKARLVCRRHADRRTVSVDSEARPACFDDDHPDCQGCREDIRAGRIETW